MKQIIVIQLSNELLLAESTYLSFNFYYVHEESLVLLLDF